MNVLSITFPDESKFFFVKEKSHFSDLEHMLFNSNRKMIVETYHVYIGTLTHAVGQIDETLITQQLRFIDVGNDDAYLIDVGMVTPLWTLADVHSYKQLVDTNKS